MTPKKPSQTRLALPTALAMGIILITAAFAAEAPPPYKIINRNLGPCKISLAVPTQWNHQVLFLAHGLREENAPLTADFDATAPYYQTLLKEGWLIASTSYRRNGYLMQEGIDDLDQLRAYVIKTYGPPKRRVIEGVGLGGAMVTRIAENQKGQYDGVLASGATLYLGSSEYQFTPQMPLLFLSTPDEISGPHYYVAKAAALKAPVLPVVWLVDRKVRNQFFDQEKLAAFRGLLAFCDTGKSEGEKDVTSAPPSVALFEKGGVWATIKAIVSDTYGNLNTDLTSADLKQLGVSLGDRVKVTCRDKTVTALYGRTYGDVPQGEWIVLLEGDFLQVARSGENAATAFSCKVGDRVFVAPALKKTNTNDK